jgi:CheY-like chemotaxis protein
MSDVWIDPGSHAVRFYDNAPSRCDSIADFLTAGASADDPLILVCRRATFEGVTALLASGRYGPPVPAGRIRFTDANEALGTFMNGDTVDLVRGAAYLGGILADVRKLQPGGTIRWYGEMVDVLCERGNFAAAIVLEELFVGAFALEPRLAVLCGYMRARFDGAGAAYKSAVCGLHTHVAEGTGDPPAQGEPPSQTSGDPSAPPPVYVIDDDASIRRSLGRLLNLTPWPVRTFDSGEAFLAELDYLPPGCLVIDIQLGGMSGLDLLAHMKATRPTWPAITMSGSHNDNAESESLRLGARVFLHKPFDAKALLDAIALALA